MRTVDKVSHINQSIEGNRKAKVSFISETRRPVFGKFVKTEDKDDLMNKGMARFVMDSDIEQFEGTDYLYLTKIYTLEAIFFIQLY